MLLFALALVKSNGRLLVVRQGEGKEVDPLVRTLGRLGSSKLLSLRRDPIAMSVGSLLDTVLRDSRLGGLPLLYVREESYSTGR